MLPAVLGVHVDVSQPAQHTNDCEMSTSVTVDNSVRGLNNEIMSGSTFDACVTGSSNPSDTGMDMDAT